MTRGFAILLAAVGAGGLAAHRLGLGPMAAALATLGAIVAAAYADELAHRPHLRRDGRRRGRN